MTDCLPQLTLCDQLFCFDDRECNKVLFFS